jgi:hypothetical protein
MKLAAAIGNNGTISPTLKFIIVLDKRIKTRQTGKSKLTATRQNENKVACWVFFLEKIWKIKLPIATEISQLAKIKPIDNSFP